MPIDLRTLEFLHSLERATSSAENWKGAFDALLVCLRPEFVYDHVALYLLDPDGRTLDVAHARAVGRGQTSEADTNWGEEIVGKVIARREAIIEEPGPGPHPDRLGAPYVIGLPVLVAGRLGGALIFVRFGGPSYSNADRMLADLVATAEASVLDSSALKEARGQVESAHRQMSLQDDFLSTISHELRTPLGFIKGFCTSLLRPDIEWDEKTRHEFLSTIDEETDRLTGLIENLLESARLRGDALEYDFRPIQLDVLLRDVTGRMQARHPELAVDLDFDSVPAISGDAIQLSRLFENLFGNAIKYAHGSPLTIRIRPGPNSLRVDFADRGPGIPPESLPFIFERFYRVPAASTASGTGLGLYICKQIVLAHHGNIWVESAPEQGATFVVQLPLSPGDGSASETLEGPI